MVDSMPWDSRFSLTVELVPFSPYSPDSRIIMMNKTFFLFLCGAICLLLQGCSYKSVYKSLRAGERNQCNKINDANERQECLNGINKAPYEEYEKSRGK